MDVDLYTQTPRAAAEDLARLGSHEIARRGASSYPKAAAVAAAASLTLASWRLLLDGSRAEDGEPHLVGTRRPLSARLSPTTANRLGLADGALVTVTGPAGSVALPLTVTDMVDGVLWAPGRVAGQSLAARTGLAAGRAVTVAAAPADTLAPVDPAATLAADGMLGYRVTGMGGRK
jgi:NADH-quinone oxidoreductase subunit G